MIYLNTSATELSSSLFPDSRVTSRNNGYFAVQPNGVGAPGSLEKARHIFKTFEVS